MQKDAFLILENLIDAIIIQYLFDVLKKILIVDNIIHQLNHYLSCCYVKMHDKRLFLSFDA
jgi:hypothetical protein